MSAQNSLRCVPLVLSLALLATIGCASAGKPTPSAPAKPNAPVIDVYDFNVMPFAGYPGTTTYTPVTIGNEANVGVYITSITVSNPQYFSVKNNCVPGLNAYGTCTASVGFTPPAGSTDYTIVYSTTLTVTDTGWQSPQTLTLSARLQPTPEPQGQLGPASVNFANVTPNTTSNYVPVTLRNTGNAPLVISNIAITGPNASSFLQDNNCPASLVAGLSCSISVRIQPTTPSSSYNASLVVTYNSNGVANAAQSIALTGTTTAAGPYPQLTISPASFDFTNTPLGETFSRTVTLTNSGTATLTLDATTTTDTIDYPVQSNSCGFTLAAGASCQITLLFTATRIGTYTAAVNFTDNALGSPVSIPINGSAVAAILTFPSGGPSFSNVSAGTTSAPYPVVLENTGNIPANISAIRLASGASPVFTETNDCPATLAAGAVCRFTFTFTPAAASRGYGSYLTVTSNSAPGILNLSLLGTSTGYTSQSKQYIEPDAGFGWLYALVNSATSTIELTSPAINDATLLTDLENACSRGVHVRALLASSSSPGYAALSFSGANCSASAYSGTGPLTQSSLAVDGNQLAVMTFPPDTSTYSTVRNFAWVNNNPRDLAAAASTFDLDYTHTTPTGYVPDPGQDLIWTPDATEWVANFITNAQYGVFIEAPSITSPTIANAILKLCTSGRTATLVLGTPPSVLLDDFSVECPGSIYINNKVHGTLILDNPTFALDGIYPGDAYISSTTLDSAGTRQSRSLGTLPIGADALKALGQLISTDTAGISPYQ